ncbi:sensor histidine kinase [Chitinimonas sp. PSY-7]|uniref:ATP-binding protein n=1 Tax=Chitinimonas sp. PSY-7 TaxID=3459088 RepID=UPI00403FF317
MIKQVLYLADNHVDAQQVQQALTHIGLDVALNIVTSAATCGEALQLTTYDLLISELPPQRNANDDAHSLAQRHQPQLPFILMTGPGDLSPSAVDSTPGYYHIVAKHDLLALKRTVKVLLDSTPASTAIQQLYLHDRLQSNLLLLTEQIAQARRQDEVLSLVLSAVRNLALADGATFIMRDGDQSYYAEEDAIAPMWLGQRQLFTSCMGGQAMMQARQIIVPDIYADPKVQHAHYRPTFARSLVMTPILQASPQAAIGAYWAQPYTPDAETLLLLQHLASITAQALANAQRYRSLERTVEERTAQLENMNHDLESFAYAVAHDLRKPLTTINGFGNILLKDYLTHIPEEARLYLMRISGEAARINEQLEDLLALFQLSSFCVQRSRINLSDIAQSIVTQLRRRGPARQVEVKIADIMPAYADPALLHALLEKLISNAWKFTSRRSLAQIEIGVQPDARGGEVFYISDNGAGFDIGSPTRLFRPFQRFHAVDEFPGSGMGLAIAQRIVHQHGGRIWGESAAGAGASFFFTLPMPN